MNTLGITLEILAVIFITLELYAFIRHLFEASKGTFILKKENPKRQIIIHSSFDQIAIGLIVNYESGFFISLHILNLHFCFIHVPKKFRPSSPAMVSYVQQKPVMPLIEWMNRGIEAANEIGGTSEMYFNAMKEGYGLDDIEEAIQHFKDIGCNCKYDIKRQEIILNL